ncbi:MAG: response regulator, partial [Moraxellaceae bacterium]|nr:response regulator [Pseudobdellovibrionaceae bacterium]
AMVEQGLDFELSHVFQTGETYTAKEINFEVKSKEGDYQKFVMDFVFDAILDPGGKIEGILLSATDMTEVIAARDAQIQARQLVEAYLGELSFEKSKFEALIEHSSSAIGFMRGADLVFEIANKKWIELVDSREHIGRKYAEIYPELVGSERYNSLVNIFKTGETFIANEMKVSVVNSHGILEDMYFDYLNVRIDDAEGKPYGVYCNANDVTDKVRARLELEKAKQDAEKANSTKSTFLANMSHEIRTPLGAIIGYADLLRETALPEFEKKHFVETILRNGKALTRIIDDILDLAKVESGKMELEYLEVNFEELISDVIDLFRERTGSKGISLQAKINPDVPKRLMTDPTRLRQIILNIVGNAVKFTEVGGITIEVIAKKISATENFIEILVKDTGVGLSFDQAQNLFKPFTQADNSTTRKFGGTGLGLALSKRLANALGGDIQIIRSAVDQGCDILITFKVHLSQKIKKDEDFVPEIFEETKNTRTLEGFKILIVDDSEDNQMLAQLILQRHGCLVDTASNGREAFRKGIEGNYDLILMDIQMPIMDGYEATRALRDSGFNRPIIALTAHAMAEERARSLAWGCNGHLTKPLDQQELIKVILKNLL